MLRRQFAAWIGSGIVLAAAAFLLLAWCVLETRRLERAHDRAVTLAHETTALLSVTQDYLLYGEPRARDQWQARYRRLGAAYAAAADDARDLDGIERMARPEQLQLLELFGELQADAPAKGDAALAARGRELAVDRLLATGQALADNGYSRERAITEQRQLSQRRLTGAALATTAALGGLYLALGALIWRQVLRPMARVHSALAAAAPWVPEPPAPKRRHDEMNALADRLESLGAELALRSRALTEREALLSLVIDHVPAMIGYWDKDGRNRLANADYRRWFGKTPAEIEGRHFIELMGPTLYAKNRPFIERALGGQRQDFERTIVGPDGVTRHSQATYVPDLRDGGVQGFIALVTDVTRRVNDEQALAQALAERDTLLKEVYHRVKNNLQLVLSLLSMQARGLGDAAAREALDDTARRVRAMALVHEQLYDAPDRAHVSLASYVSGLIQQLGRSHGCDGTGPVRLVADVIDTTVGLDTAVPLGLLLTELVANSLKHAFPDGRSGQVTVRVQPLEGGVRIAVIDDGVGSGMAPASARAPEGTGAREPLGRLLADRLAGQLGGTLHGEETPGGGTTAWVQVPHL
jgi:PAS domain S-box-containing protein